MFFVCVGAGLPTILGVREFALTGAICQQAVYRAPGFFVCVGAGLPAILGMRE
jgi:hypothetical protein